jgi:TolB-like protein
LSLFNELQRRNVFRVAIGYIVSSWLLAQVADLVLENIGAPDWVMQTILLVLALGFPVVVFFSWAYEVTPEGIKRESEVDRTQSTTQVTGRKLDRAITGVLVIALAYFVYDKFVLDPSRDEALVEATTQAVTERAPVEPEIEANTEKSIAVLPFVNMSDDKDYFADGLSEELLNLLAKVPDLKVAGRTSAFKFKGQNEDLRIIGDALNVSTVLEGSVRKSGTRLRITAQLINVADGYHIWSETYDREMTDVFDMQDDIADKIMAALKMHLGDTTLSRGRPTENMLAYEKFVTAKALLSSAQDRRGFELLLEVVALDPTFAEAWEQLSITYWFGGDGTLFSEDAMAGCFSAATRALDLDPTLVLAAAMAGSCDAEGWSWPQELAALEPAVRQMPNDTGALLSLSFDYLEAGYVSEALLLAERLVVIEPLSPNSHRSLGDVLRASGRVEEARVAWQRSMELGSVLSARALFVDYMLASEIDRAIVAHDRAMQMNGEDPAGVADRIRAAADPVTGRQALLDWLEVVPDSPFWTGSSWIYFLAFRQWDDLFAVIDAYNAKATTWSDADNIMNSVTIFRDSGITADPRYVAAMTDYGVVEAWDTRGPPDYCSKDTGTWVCK